MSASGLGAQMAQQAVGSHRGHGFAFGHVNFPIPNPNMRVRPLTTRARALTPDRFRRDGNQHGNAEQGNRDRERDRDRGSGSTTAGDSESPDRAGDCLPGNSSGASRSGRVESGT